MRVSRYLSGLSRIDYSLSFIYFTYLIGGVDIVQLASGNSAFSLASIVASVKFSPNSLFKDHHCMCIWGVLEGSASPLRVACRPLGNT